MLYVYVTKVGIGSLADLGVLDGIRECVNNFVVLSIKVLPNK